MNLQSVSPESRVNGEAHKGLWGKKEKQHHLDKAYKLARIGTWEYDMLNGKLYWSPVTKEVHGFGPDYEPDVEKTIQLFKEGFNRTVFAQAAHDAIEHHKPFDVELKIVSGQGDERWIRATGEPEYENGVCVRFYGISQNVTGRKQDNGIGLPENIGPDYSSSLGIKLIDLFSRQLKADYTLQSDDSGTAFTLQFYKID